LILQKTHSHAKLAPDNERLNFVAACAAHGELDGVEIEDGKLYIARISITVAF
jgi:hypothetical protein